MPEVVPENVKDVLLLDALIILSTCLAPRRTMTDF